MTKQQNILLISTGISLSICLTLILIFYEQMKQTIQGSITGNYFSDRELYASAKAKKNNINNTPTADAWRRLYALRDNILNPARKAYGSCVYINVAYRCPELNKLVGGTSDSQHQKGEAADITTKSIKGNRILFAILVQLGNYDQLIWEGNGSWIHVSYSLDRAPRNQILAQIAGTNKYKNINTNWQTAIA